MGGCCALSFDELCGAPLGAGDYLRLATTYDAVLMVSHKKDYRRRARRLLHWMLTAHLLFFLPLPRPSPFSCPCKLGGGVWGKPLPLKEVARKLCSKTLLLNVYLFWCT